MKFLMIIFLFGAGVIGLTVAILSEDSRMQYSDPLAVAQNRDCVVVLHGLNMGPWHMSRLADSLSREGYDVFNIGYDSNKGTIPEIATYQVYPKLPQNCSGRIHFVGHSMGGLVIRQLLGERYTNKVGRIVMLGTPNHGSEIIDFNMSTPIVSTIFDMLFGPAAHQLGTKDNPYLEQLASPGVQTGIIAGDRFIDPIGATILPEPNDGKVTVASTLLPTMTDFRLMHVSHFWMPFDHAVRAQTIHFLKTGRFD